VYNWYCRVAIACVLLFNDFLAFSVALRNDQLLLDFRIIELLGAQIQKNFKTTLPDDPKEMSLYAKESGLLASGDWCET
jgi:hypothetical protein